MKSVMGSPHGSRVTFQLLSKYLVDGVDVIVLSLVLTSARVRCIMFETLRSSWLGFEPYS